MVEIGEGFHKSNLVVYFCFIKKTRLLNTQVNERK